MKPDESKNRIERDHEHGDQRRAPERIRADAALPLQGFVSVMDKVKTLGFKELNLQTESL